MPVVTALCSTRNEQLAPPSFRRLTAVDSQPAPLVSADEAQTLYLWARFEEGSDLDVVTDVSAGCDLPVSDDGTTAVPLVDGCVLRYGTAKATADTDAISEAHIVLTKEGSPPSAEAGVTFVKLAEGAFLRLARGALAQNGLAETSLSKPAAADRIDKALLDEMHNQSVPDEKLARFIELAATTPVDARLVPRVHALLRTQREQLVQSLGALEELPTGLLRCLALTFDPNAKWQRAAPHKLPSDPGSARDAVFASTANTGLHPLFAANLNHFGNSGGFEALQRRIDPDVPPHCTLRELIMSLSGLRAARHLLANAFAKPYFARLQESVLARLTRASDDELRELTESDSSLLNTLLKVSSVPSSTLLRLGSTPSLCAGATNHISRGPRRGRRKVSAHDDETTPHVFSVGIANQGCVAAYGLRPSRAPSPTSRHRPRAQHEFGNRHGPQHVVQHGLLRARKVRRAWRASSVADGRSACGLAES